MLPSADLLLCMQKMKPTRNPDWLLALVVQQQCDEEMASSQLLALWLVLSPVIALLGNVVFCWTVPQQWEGHCWGISAMSVLLELHPTSRL